MNEANGLCLVEWYQKVAKEGKIDKDALTDWTVCRANIGLLPSHLISFTIFLSGFLLPNLSARSYISL